MTARRPSRLALALFDYAAGGNEPLKGDLIEEFGTGRSQWWLWRQVIGALFHTLVHQPTSPSLQPHQGADMVLLGAVVLALITFEAVFVTGLMQRLTFGPALPNISGHLYLLQKGRVHTALRDAAPAPVASMYGPLLSIAASVPIGWLIARFHQRHHALSIGGFALSVTLCAALNLQSLFAVQFVTTLMFIIGLLVGGRFASDAWTARAA